MENLALHGGAPIRSEEFPPWPIWSQEEERGLLEVLRSGRWNRHDKVTEFEEHFSAYHDAKYGLAVSSGTTAIQTALKAIGVRDGDEVIVPAYTFGATATAVLLSGCVPVFVDCDDCSCNISADAIRAAITERTKAVIAVHIGGRPVDFDAILPIALANGLYVIEDCAQAHAASWKGCKVGAIGDIGTFSFQASKNLNAGEGGFITTNDEELMARAWAAHNCGRQLNGLGAEGVVAGGNYRITEFQAAILLKQLTRLDQQNEKRTRGAELLNDLLKGIEGVDPLAADARITSNAYHLYIFRYRSRYFNGLSLDLFIRAMQAEGIPCRRGYAPLYKAPAIVNHFTQSEVRSPHYEENPIADYSICPVTERICEESVWLLHNVLLGEDRDLRDIASAMEKIRKFSANLN